MTTETTLPPTMTLNFTRPQWGIPESACCKAQWGPAPGEVTALRTGADYIIKSICSYFNIVIMK